MERAERARDAALTLSRDLSETSDELRQKSLELTRERDQLQEQVASLTKASGDRCNRENLRTFNDANCQAAQVPPAKPLNSSETSVTPTAMQACLGLLTADTGNRAVLDELENHFHSFGERARAQGSVALDRLSAGCEQLTSWLKKTPGKIAENIGPLANAVELLGRIAAIDEPDRVTDTADALVYSLDADVDNCECITMAMERIALKGRYATKPKVAVNDLTAGPCDLIILDLDVPDMNGFDFFALVRALPHHKKTPVIFLSGVMESEAHAAQLQDNAHAFVPKPYNLNTLGLIALSMILKARLAALEERPVQGRSTRRRPRIKA
ncbi:MAG TPA: response regulator [Chthoniobacteraceae bacterium]|nr:response regulator [Chthoniobacteraceae bacterium]